MAVAILASRPQRASADWDRNGNVFLQPVDAIWFCAGQGERSEPFVPDRIHIRPDDVTAFRSPAGRLVSSVGDRVRSQGRVDQSRENTMSIRMTKVVLALGLMAAAGSSNAFLVMTGSSVRPLRDHYCAFLAGGGVAYDIQENTMGECEARLLTLSVGMPAGSAVGACHLCSIVGLGAVTGGIGNGAGSVADLPADLSIETIRHFLDGTRTLRERYRIDEYERAQQEFERSLQPAPKP